jgi:hypothetical protein
VNKESTNKKKNYTIDFVLKFSVKQGVTELLILLNILVIIALGRRSFLEDRYLYYV